MAGVAVDSLNDVWVLNDSTDGSTHIYIYSPYGSLLGTSNPGVPVQTIATRGAWHVFGTNNEFAQYPTGEVLTNGGIAGSASFANVVDVTALAFDASGNYYVESESGITKVNPYTKQMSTVTRTTYFSGGMVVDSARARLYVSDPIGRAVQVYSLASSNYGQLIYTIN